MCHLIQSYSFKIIVHLRMTFLCVYFYILCFVTGVAYYVLKLLFCFRCYQRKFIKIHRNDRSIAFSKMSNRFCAYASRERNENSHNIWDIKNILESNDSIWEKEKKALRRNITPQEIRNIEIRESGFCST